MIGLKRNQRTFYCASFTGIETPMDGERRYYLGPVKTYGPPVLMEGFVSAATGRAAVEAFGENIRYDRTIIIYDPEAPVEETEETEETSVFWIDSTPVLKEDGTTETPYDYVVKRVARSLNLTAVAVAKVAVSQ